MSDKLRVQSFSEVLSSILQEYEQSESIFGIHRSMFYVPKKESPYATEMFGFNLATPIGPAAGPHTQLARNIISAWLSGGRFMELKTVQIMDELEIPRPCIDVEDEGYNVEWSQELKLDESVHEYINAWVVIHILRRVLGFEGETPFGTIFNMSVGYNLEGIKKPRMVKFMDTMVDASKEISSIKKTLAEKWPEFADIDIPTRLTNSVTLSTMHGCPPDEIEQIARYLIEERGLHTIIKLNPTLLGKDEILHILHDELGFADIEIPDGVFDHDLQYDRAVCLISDMKETATRHGLFFGVKLSNTLAMANHRDVLPGEEMYMSGRALYPITINLFYKLVHQFDGDLNVSYSGGADALNVTTILAAGARPVTAASDLLKPGGYSRLLQYLENLEGEMRARGVSSLDELARDRLANLERAAADTLKDRRYKKSYHPYGLPKVESGLELFDCIAAPCVEQCAVLQDVPEYAWLIAKGEYDRALAVILAHNPLPGVTGYVCTHHCQSRCTRNNYDEPVAIRALKRFATTIGKADQIVNRKSQIVNRRVAVIGSGPSGLAAAYYLALNGVLVTIYEAKDVAGGMLAIAPTFRLPPTVVQEDIHRITGMGVDIKLSHPINAPPEELTSEGFNAVYVACGFQKDAKLSIEGIEGEGVFTALDFLERVARGEKPNLGSRVLVIGGGNTAIDAARTAKRLTGGPVTVLYRRTQHEMPAEEEELWDLFEEGNCLEELVSPKSVTLQDGAVTALQCVRNKLGDPGADGRRKPIPIEGSEFEIAADSIIVAIGQAPDIAFLNGSIVSLRADGTIAVDPDTGAVGTSRVYAGGDAARGPATIIQACADGRRAAEAICAKLNIQFEQLAYSPTVLPKEEILQVKQARARKEAKHSPKMLPVAKRSGFDLIEQTLTEEEARGEAARCLQCSTLCDKCVEVCPNRANYTYFVTPVSLTLPQLSFKNDRLAVTGEETFEVKQKRQIIHIDDFCNECGNCATFCVHNGKPYLEKPRLFLKEADFRLEDDNAFYIVEDTIRRREGGRESRLSVEEDMITFENAHVRIDLSPDFKIKKMTLKEAFAGTFSLRGAAEMTLILDGVTTSLPFLL